MIDRHAHRLMVAYLYLDLAAMFGAEVKFTSEAPLNGVDANRHNHVRLAADDVRHNGRTITVDLPVQRFRVARLVVDAHVPAAEVVQVQFGAVEPLAESLARAADERNTLIVLLLACALTQNVEVGRNRPEGGYDGAGRRTGHLDATDGTGGCRSVIYLGFGRRRAGVGISHTLKYTSELTGTNFIRIPLTLRTSPALEAGVTDRLGSVEGGWEVYEQRRAERAA